MATLADSLKTSSSRPLGLRKRADLASREHRYQGRSYWVVKEPVGLKYFRFQEEEYAILQMLDGTTSLDDLKTRFERRFSPQKITFSDLQQFIGTLHRNGLVVSQAAGQGLQLKQRRDERRSKERMAALANILAMRFKGFDPQWILDAVYPFIKWFFSPLAVAGCIMMALAALSLILVHFDTFQARLPAFHEFFGPQNWLLLGITLAVTKILHEFGHGFSCKHFGGECHEIGVMLLVLTPCLYCNVSDSWMLPNKWKRAAIGAAGMYVELCLASIATFVWWFTDPGTLNYLALRVMFICSVSTVMFNGNPLLRYDGYYILSDLIEIPNLRQKASAILNRVMARWCLGLDLPEQPFLPQRNHFMFALYTVASSIYRWVVLVSILVFLYKVFEPYGLQVLGQIIAGASVVSMIVKPLWDFWKFMTIPGRMEQVKKRNLWATVGVLTALVAGVLMIPLPRRVACSLEVRPRDAVAVWVDVPGRLEEVLVKPGEQVREGQPLARLTNTDLPLAIADLNGQLNESVSRLTSLRRERYKNQRAGEEIAQVKEQIAALEEQLADKEKERARLQLTSPAAGTVIPSVEQRDPPKGDGTLAKWSGSLLEGRNLGATLSESVQFCDVGNPKNLEAVLIIDQSDIEMVHKGQTVYIKLESYPGTTLEGEIVEIAQGDLKVAPRSLSTQQGGDLATRTDAAGIQRPLNTSYSARVPIDDPAGKIQLGSRGHALVYTGYQPLGGRIWRYLSHTFHFWM